MSLIYDSSIGHHLFNYLAEVAEKDCGVPKGELQLACQKFFAEKFPDHEKYFPKTIYYYGDKPYAFNYFPLIDTKKAPVWRP